MHEAPLIRGLEWHAFLWNLGVVADALPEMIFVAKRAPSEGIPKSASGGSPFKGRARHLDSVRFGSRRFAFAFGGYGLRYHSGLISTRKAIVPRSIWRD